MKAKKWLTIITLVITALSLVLAFIIGKNSNCITYDISMAIFGGAALGFIMSLTEYYVERRKAMEEFWLQATKVLNELKKIKYLDVDAPINLIVDAIHEDDSNALKKKFHLLSDDEKISVNLGILVLCLFIAAAKQRNALLFCSIIEQVHNNLVLKDTSEDSGVDHFALRQILLGNEIRTHQFILVHLISEQFIVDGFAERIPFHNAAIVTLTEDDLFANDSGFTVIDT